jgi:hypothetical protein
MARDRELPKVVRRSVFGEVPQFFPVLCMTLEAEQRVAMRQASLESPGGSA